MRGPVEDAAAPHLGAPGRLADLFGMDGEPRAHQRLGDRHADRARARRSTGRAARRSCGDNRRTRGDQLGLAKSRSANAMLSPRNVIRSSSRALPRRGSPTNGSSGTAISLSGWRPRRRKRVERACARRGGGNVRIRARPATARRCRRGGSAACLLRFLSEPSSSLTRPSTRRYWRHRRTGPPLNVAVPATSASAPAAIARGAVTRSIPPSTSRSTVRPLLVDHRPDALDLAQRRFDEALPAEPGIDAHDRAPDRLPRADNRALWPGSAGSARRPARLPSDADVAKAAVRVRAGLDMDARSCRRRLRRTGRGTASTGAIIKWTSSGLAVCGRIAFTTAGPIVMLGTKWPSITSTWIQSAPAASIARTSSPNLAKSALRIDGAMRTGCCMRVRLSGAHESGNEEAVAAALRFERAGQDADPALGARARCRRGARPAAPGRSRNPCWPTGTPRPDPRPRRVRASRSHRPACRPS